MHSVSKWDCNSKKIRLLENMKYFRQGEVKNHRQILIIKQFQVEIDLEVPNTGLNPIDLNPY